MYQKMYLILFNGITDAVEKMEQNDFKEALNCLKCAQQKAEECYITWDEGEKG